MTSPRQQADGYDLILEYCSRGTRWGRKVELAVQKDLKKDLIGSIRTLEMRHELVVLPGALANRMRTERMPNAPNHTQCVQYSVEHLVLDAGLKPTCSPCHCLIPVKLPGLIIIIVNSYAVLIMSSLPLPLVVLLLTLYLGYTTGYSQPFGFPSSSPLTRTLR